ncbi:MAG: hypothetical protein E6G70_08065 [Alphaproteobacteria bacterium]|nr:MAG: hypothetical protein E6G70_08065 [Alphaproteobacteria bacterium]
MRSKHPGVRVTVKRMSTARIVVLSIAPGAGGIAASPAGGSAQTGSRDQASKCRESVNGVHRRIAIQTTAQK